MQFTLSAITAIVAFASTAIAGPIAARSSSMYMITIKNSCSETVWPGLGQVASSPSQINTEWSGFELTAGSQRTIAVPTTWTAGRVFGRTGCSGSGTALTCSVGDCGGLYCSDNTGVSGVTLAEFSASGMDDTFYNISLISGFNLGMKITPTVDSCPTFDCSSESCSADQAYLPGATNNPCSGCTLNSGYTVEFCPSS